MRPTVVRPYFEMKRGDDAIRESQIRACGVAGDDAEPTQPRPSSTSFHELARSVREAAKSAHAIAHGHYCVLGMLGQGGMGRVYLGRTREGAGVSRLVAVKQLHEHLADDEEVVGRFLDEGRFSSQIRHPNVVPTFDVVTAKGALSLIQEYVEGAALSTLLKNARARHEHVPIRVAVAIAIGLLHGLGASHEATNERGERLEIVHRDISPHNVLVGVDGVARITDFGVASGAGRLVVTEEGGLRGKLRYMAPEQLHGAVTQQIDLYATGAVLWEMLTGARMIAAKDEAAVVGAILRGNLPKASTRRSDVPAELDAIVAKALARDVAERYATAIEMATALAMLEPASPEEVAAFVHDFAREELAERKAMIGADVTDDYTPVEGVPANLESATRPVFAKGRSDAPTLTATPVVTSFTVAPFTAPPKVKKRFPFETVALGVGFVIALTVVWCALSPRPVHAAPVKVNVKATAAPVAPSMRMQSAIMQNAIIQDSPPVPSAFMPNEASPVDRKATRPRAGKSGRTSNRGSVENPMLWLPDQRLLDHR